jgi:predicted HTH transcriptional regulator
MRSLEERVDAALDRALEAPDVDFKESAPWDGLKWKIVRAALGMGNLRGGGLIIVGVSERGEVWDLQGIEDEHLATYESDLLADLLDKHVSPAAKVEAVLHERDEKTYLVFDIGEFDELPFVCRRGGPDLEPGAIYVRPLSGRPRTERIRSADDMRELLALAAEKGARRILELMQRLGRLPAIEVPVLEDVDRQRFDEEPGEL